MYIIKLLWFPVAMLWDLYIVGFAFFCMNQNLSEHTSFLPILPSWKVGQTLPTPKYETL